MGVLCIPGRFKEEMRSVFNNKKTADDNRSAVFVSYLTRIFLEYVFPSLV